MSINTPYGPPDLDDQQDAQNAAELLRQKVARAYTDEPNAGIELQEAEAVPERSKHQQFMHQLSTSGKDMVAIQTEWHHYYQSLPPSEQHEVWQEFYASRSVLATAQDQPAPSPHREAQTLAAHKQQVGNTQAAKRAATQPNKPKKLRDARSTKEVQAAIRDTVTAGGKLEAKHHLQSLLFGLGMGFVVVVIFLFGFFNEIIIAPFIQPSRVAASTPLIVSTDSVAPSATPEVIIPKINVQIPVDYTQTGTNEEEIQTALESGVVHYPTTVKPGQKGNAAYFGHSSNNIFNKGKYKFAFVMLRTLVPGDTFYLTSDGKVYVYKIISKTVVDPSEVGVLNAVPGQVATATLITCDPPGTSLKRLVIVGQQISPDPAGNTDGVAQTIANAPSAAKLPGNAPTLWGRFIGSGTGKAIVTIIVVGGLLVAIRHFNGRRR